MFDESRVTLRKAETAGMLERMCRALELTAAQYETAKSRYEGVGGWLADSESPLLRGLSIYLQGSTALGTTVKPIGAERTRRRSRGAYAHARSAAASDGEKNDRRPAAGERTLRPAAAGDAALLAPQLRQRIPSRHHAVDSATRYARTAANSFPTRR